MEPKYFKIEADSVIIIEEVIEDKKQILKLIRIYTSGVTVVYHTKIFPMFPQSFADVELEQITKEEFTELYQLYSTKKQTA